MKRALIYVNNQLAGELQEVKPHNSYRAVYSPNYKGPSISLEMPTSQSTYEFDRFPPFFEGLLPEGMMLDAFLRQSKIDRNDLMSQLLVVGHDLVGNITVIEAKE